jgi:hypothetical protein
MDTLLLKLILTPALIGTASLAGRRWGHSISGWIVALPMTTGPITFLLAISHGAAFAATAAAGTLAGGFSQAAFVLCYARMAAHWKWLPTLGVSIVSFAVITAILRQLTFPLVPLCLLVFLDFLISIRLLPRTPDPAEPIASLPGQWDIPMRMLIATVFVLIITGLAPAFGPRLTGLLAPFPIFTATLAAFAHHQYGLGATVNVLRGLLMGLFSFASFFFVLALMLQPAGILLSFAVAILVVIILQGISLRLLRHQPG